MILRMSVRMDLDLKITPRYNVPPNHDGMNLRNIKLEAPTFDGQLDPYFFLDWTLDMDHYFNWYNV